jgi:phenylacetate-CoA ligase
MRRSSIPLLLRKRLTDVGAAIRVEQVLLRRNSWTRQRLWQFQQDRLQKLVEHAIRYSPFYRDYYRDVDITKPLDLSALPIMTKRLMMEYFDQVVTDRNLRLANLLRHLSQLQIDEYYGNKYRCVMSSGTTGLQGLFIFNRREWSTILGAVRRAAIIMSDSDCIMFDGPTATIASHTPTHLSRRIELSLAVLDSSTPTLTAASGIPLLTNDLNDLQPAVLRTYPSVIDLLAIEQLDGSLRIHPRLVSTFGETLSPSTVQRVRDAWGITPFNSFAMSEGLFGAECRFHSGVHFFDDLGILEVIDENCGNAPLGLQGRQILVTNLYNYTQPLIRYEVSDMVTLAPDTCPCGIPFTLITCIAGRQEDALYMTGKDGKSVALHAGLFRGTVGDVPGVKQFEILWRPDALNIKVVLRPGAIAEAVAHRIQREIRMRLESNHVLSAVINVDIVDKVEIKNKGGKPQVVRRVD